MTRGDQIPSQGGTPRPGDSTEVHGVQDSPISYLKEPGKAGVKTVFARLKRWRALEGASPVGKKPNGDYVILTTLDDCEVTFVPGREWIVVKAIKET